MENIITPMEGVLTIVDQFGQEVQYQLLFQIESKEFNKKYVVFFDLEDLKSGDQGQINLAAGVYVTKEDGSENIEQIESQEEWAVVQQAIEEFSKEMEEGAK